jgi:ribosome modulation factor
VHVIAVSFLREVLVPDFSKSPEDIFKAGMDARVRGEQVTACPYPDESGEREHWLEGWHEPDDLDEPDELGFA